MLAAMQPQGYPLSLPLQERGRLKKRRKLDARKELTLFMDANVFKSRPGDIICSESGVFTLKFLNMNPHVSQHKKMTIIEVKKVESLVPALIMTALLPDGKVIKFMDEDIKVDKVISLQ